MAKSRETFNSQGRMEKINKCAAFYKEKGYG